MKEINQALFKIQTECPPIEKKGINSHFKNNYALLPDILSILKPLFIKHKVFLSSQETTKDNAEYLTVSLYHLESGESKSTDVKLLNILDMQKLGSATTYAMRYGVLELLGLCPDIDDDGNKNAGIDDKKETKDKEGEKDEFKEIKESKEISQLRKLFNLKKQQALKQNELNYNNIEKTLAGEVFPTHEILLKFIAWLQKL